MKPEQLGKLAEVLSGSLEPEEASRVYVRGVCVDSRKILPGELFFALVGRRDGHNFVMDAYSRGAIGAVVQRKIDIPMPQIIVEDTLAALGKLAKTYRETIDPEVIAITGSVGKTTTREMIAHILSVKYKTHSAKLNYNNLIGLPLTLLDMDADAQIAVVELGINQKGEMERLADIAQPDAGVFTAIAPVHTEGLGSIDGIVTEKMKMLQSMPQSAPVFINADSQPLVKATRSIRNEVITYAIENDADFKAENIEFTDGRATFTVGDARFKLPLLGKAAIYSALAATAVAKFFDISEKVSAQALLNIEPARHRMHLVQLGEVTVLDDSYNSSPAALQEAVKTMMLIPARRRIAVLGDMLELGALAEKYHRKAGELIAKSEIDGAVLFGELMKSAYKKLKSLGFGGDVIWSDDFDEAREGMLKIIEPGDLILVKGSNSMRMGRFIEAIEESFGGGNTEGGD